HDDGGTGVPGVRFPAYRHLERCRNDAQVMVAEGTATGTLQSGHGRHAGGVDLSPAQRMILRSFMAARSADELWVFSSPTNAMRPPQASTAKRSGICSSV